MRKQIFWHLA